MSNHSSIGNRASEFLPLAGRGWRGVVHQDWRERAGELVEIEKVLEGVEKETLRKGGGQGVTVRCGLFGEPVFVKRYDHSTLRRWVRDACGYHRALAEWNLNCTATERGVGTARVMTAMSLRRGITWRHYFVTRPAPGFSIPDTLNNHPRGSTERNAYLESLGRFVGLLHNERIYHAHLRGPHIFHDPEAGFSLIDMENSVFGTVRWVRLERENARQINDSLANLVTKDEWQLCRRAYREERRRGGISDKDLVPAFAGGEVVKGSAITPVF